MNIKQSIAGFVIAFLFGATADASFVYYPLPRLVSNSVAIVEGRVLVSSQTNLSDGIFKVSWEIAVDRVLKGTVETAERSDGTNHFHVIIAVTLTGPKVPSDMGCDISLHAAGVFFIGKSPYGPPPEYEACLTRHSVVQIEDEIHRQAQQRD